MIFPIDPFADSINQLLKTIVDKAVASIRLIHVDGTKVTVAVQADEYDAALQRFADAGAHYVKHRVISNSEIELTINCSSPLAL